jgi:hypothetical protein
MILETHKNRIAYLLNSPRSFLTLHKAVQPQPLPLWIDNTILLLNIFIHQETPLWIFLAINRNLTPEKLANLLLLRLSSL